MLTDNHPSLAVCTTYRVSGLIVPLPVQSFYENIGLHLKQIAIVLKLVLFNFITATEKHTKSLPESVEWKKSKFMVKYQYF